MAGDSFDDDDDHDDDDEVRFALLLEFCENSSGIFRLIYRVRTGHGKPGRSWNLTVSRGKS